MKKIFEPLSTAWVAVISHKLRSFLTILGVVIGITAVIILMSVGKGTEATILNQISGLGANMIMVRPGSSNSGGIRGGFGSASTLTLEDANAIAANVTNINGVAPTTSLRHAGGRRKSKYECPGYGNHSQLSGYQ